MQDQEAIQELNGDVMLQLNGDAKAAQKQYSEALKSRPNDPRLLTKLADADMRLGNIAQTKTVAQSALAGGSSRVLGPTHTGTDSDERA